METIATRPELFDPTGTCTPSPEIRFLIADDVPSTRKILRAALHSRPGYEVVGEAEDGFEAILLAADREPDVVLLDLNMPNVDGPAALGDLRLAVPDALIIVISGADPSDISESVRTTATMVLPKGLPAFELLARIIEVVDTHSLGSLVQNNAASEPSER